MAETISNGAWQAAVSDPFVQMIVASLRREGFGGLVEPTAPDLDSLVTRHPWVQPKDDVDKLFMAALLGLRSING